MTSFYGEDLADIHHAGFTDFVESAAPGILTLFRAHGIGGGRVLDLGCGSGVLTHHLTSSGFDVTGIDVSSAMIAHAQRMAPRAEFVRGSFFDVDLPPFVAVPIPRDRG